MARDADGDEFYAAFWLLPSAPLPALGEIVSDGEPLPEPVLQRRAELQRALTTLDVTKADDVRNAIGVCDLYVRSLRSARTVMEMEGRASWGSAIVDQTCTIPIAFEEPMALVVEGVLLLNLGSAIARSNTLECVSASVQCFCQAAGLIDFVVTVEEDISSSLHADVPVEMPELAPRILHALADMALVMAQQLAIVKAALYFDGSYSKSVLQKLHTACQSSYEAFQTAVVRSCYSARPRRDSCSTLLGFATVFSRLHRAMALQVKGKLEFTGGRVGEAIAYLHAALHQLQERQSMRDIGLPPLDDSNRKPPGGVEGRLIRLLSAKRADLQTQLDEWCKDNDSIYFATVPSEQTVLAVEMPCAIVMKAAPYDVNKRLGSVQMFREAPIGSPQDLVVAITGAEGHEDKQGKSSDRDSETDQEGQRRKESSAHSESEEEHDGIVQPVHLVTASEGDRRHEASLTSSPSSPQAVTGEDPLPIQVPPLSFQQRNGNEASPPSTSARSNRRMATRVQTQKSVTSRKLLAMESIGHHDSLVRMNLGEEQLKKAVTEEAVATMKRAMLSSSGIEVYRLAKDKWKKEVLRVHDEALVFVRRKAFGLLSLSKQLKVPWSTVFAFQHELLPVNQVLQLVAPPGKRMTSILVIAGRGDKVGPTEIALATPEANACAVACLQSLHMEKRRPR